MPSLAVVGHPVEHSRSPDMQTAALAAMGLAGEWNYGMLDFAPEDFEAGVAELAIEGEYAGLNVTIPHKEAALALADTADEAARAIGAANTLTLRGEEIAASNTDAPGLLASLPAETPIGRALVLGAGGAARAVIWALTREGFTVDVWNRTAARAEEVAPALGGAPVADPDPSAYGLLVNTTAVGLRAEDPFEHLPLGTEGFAPEQVVVDMVYGESPSPILAAAGAAGARTVDGIEVLVQQGARSLAHWLELPALEDEVVDAMRLAAYGDDAPIA